MEWGRPRKRPPWVDRSPSALQSDRVISAPASGAISLLDDLNKVSSPLPGNPPSKGNVEQKASKPNFS